MTPGAVVEAPGRSFARWWVPVTGALLITVIVALTVFDMVRTRALAERETAQRLRAQGRIIAEQTLRSLQAVHLVLRHVADDYRAGSVPPPGAALHQYLRDRAIGLEQIGGLSIFGAGGDLLATSWSPEVPATSVRSRSSFQRMRDNPPESSELAPAMRSEIDRKWIVPMGRRLESATGSFGGVVSARISIDHFQGFYESLQLDRGTRIALRYTDGTLLARYPRSGDAVGTRFEIQGDGQAVLDDSDPPVRRVHSPVDAAEVYSVVLRAGPYPLDLILSQDTEAALADWRDQAVGVALRTLLLCLLAGGLLVLLQQRVVRLEAARSSLAASRERFALAVAAANDGVCDWDFVAGTVFVSTRAQQLLGLEPGPEVRPMERWEQSLRFHPDDVAGARALLDAADPRSDSREGEFRVVAADGASRWVRVRCLPLRDAAGRLVRMSAAVSDIDATKRAEEALRRSDERYQLAVLGSTEGLWDWDLRTDELFLSPRCQELVWAHADEPLQPRRLWIERTRYHPDDRAALRQALKAHLRGETDHLQVEYRLQQPDGSWRWVRQRGVALRDADGRPYRMAGSMEDITDRKRAEAERERVEQQRRHSHKLEAMGTLAGGIAHDFNNILSAILGYGEMARKRAAEDATVSRYLDAALGAGLRAKSLVERILAFSRSGLGERMPVHIQSIVGEALTLQRASLPLGISLEVRLDAGDAAICGDPTQVHQVVMNLCANAVQAMGTTGRLEVAVDRVELGAARSVTTGRLPPGPYVRLVVRDSGSGIPPRVMERIFDPFFTTKEVGVGTGLGLSLVHGIVGDLGGGVDVDSDVGRGTTMTVYVPQTGEMTPAGAVEDSLPEGRGETVLIVDDEEGLVRLGEEMLGDLGYEPVGFASSLAALASFRSTPDRFDVVVTDESMPEMTGSELARQIRALRPSVPIVIMTGHATAELARRARELGVAEVLNKPLVARDMARGLASALQRPPAPPAAH